jgi:hypothetical protein
MKFIKGFLAAVAVAIVIILGLTAVVGVIAVPAGLINKATCHRYGRMTGREVRPAWPGACYVHTDDGWFTVEQIRQNSK